MRKFGSLLAFVGALLAPAGIGAAESARSLDQLDLRIWNTDQGLPHNSVLSLGQTADGMLWVGTWGGLARFDGVEFRTYDRDNTPAIGDNGILAMTPSAGGGLWVGTHRGGLLRVEQGRISREIEVGTTIGGHVLALVEAGDTIWIGTEGAGLYRWQDGRTTPFEDAHIGPLDTVHALALEPTGALRAGTRKGAYRIEPGATTSTALDLPTGSEAPLAVMGMVLRHDGEAWLASPLGVFRQPGASQPWVQVSKDPGSSLSIGRNGQIWVGTPANGVLRLDGRQQQQLRTVHGLPDSRVRAVLEDRNGGVWLGTNGGLVGMQSLPFSGIGNLRGLSNEYVRSLLQTRDGSAWVATAHGLNHIVDGRPEPVTSIPLLRDGSLLSLAEDGEGVLWIGTYADGLVGLDDGRLLRPEGLVLPNPQVRAIVVARDRTLWIGTQGGLAHYDPAQRRMLPIPGPGISASIMALHEDLGGRLWIGTSEGLARIEDGQLRHVAPEDGFPGEAVFSFLEENAQELWIGSDAGLVHARDGRYTVLGPARGLPFYSVLGVIRDDTGTFWLSSGTGVYRVARDTVMAALGRPEARLAGRLFTRDDGMPSNQCNGGSQPAALRLDSGQLWFATARGVALVDPNEIDERPPEPPRIVLNRVTIDDKDQSHDERVVLPPGRHTLAVQFAAIALSRQGLIDNAYRVVGLDERWEHIGSERSVRLTNLPPGEYALELAARFGNGALSPTPARFEFSIEPAAWQRPGVLAALFLLAVALVVVVFQRRTANLQRRSVELKRLVAEQTQKLAHEMAVIAERDRENTELLGQLELKSLELERLAREDGLTGVFNRRHFDQRFDELVGAGHRDGHPGPAVLLLDLDHFKQINDNHSHHVGDRVLQRFAELLREEFADALVARFGGEEFAVALPVDEIDAARARAERLRERVAREPWRDIAEGLAVTVSIGVAVRGAETNPDRMITVADARLYAAKRGGRNRVA